MKRCHNCGGRFGLVRHRHYTLHFCTARCLEVWKRVQSDKARQHRFLQWLLPDLSPAVVPVAVRGRVSEQLHRPRPSRTSPGLR